MATHLADEMFRIFPELRELSSEGDEALPYVLMSNLVRFLEARSIPVLPAALIGRVLEFNFWCQQQPRGDNAGDDVLTILVVGFYEPAIESETLRGLVPQLIAKSDMVDNKDYLVRWVGQENYDRAIALYSGNDPDVGSDALNTAEPRDR
jgi:hypothetical protein